MIATQDIFSEVEKTATDFIHALSKFSDQQVNKVPFEGSWTAGQVAEHILKASSGVPGVLLGATCSTQRPVDEKEAALKSIFLDFSAKFKAPEFIVPSPGPHNREQLLQSLQETKDSINNLADKIDLTATCTSVAFPQLGELTGQEWLCFVDSHLKRHTHQLKNIYRVINEEE